MKWILATIMMISLNAFAASADSSASTLPAIATATTSPAPVATDAPTPSATVAAVATTTDSAKQETSTLLKTKETDIPVHLGNDKKTATTDSPVFKVLMSLSVIGILGCAAFFWIRKYAKKGNSKNQATQIKVLTQHYLGPKKSLAIIRVAGESILVGITDQNISLIKELALLDEDIPEATPKSFKTVFSLGATSNPNDTARFGDDAAEDQAADDELDARDEFSISGIKDFVSSKLKNMRSIE